MANTNVTMPRAQVSVLPLPSSILGFNRVYKIKFSDIAFGTGSTDTVTVSLGSVPAPWLVTQCMAVVRTAFAGTGALTLTAGTSGTADAFLTSSSVMSAGVKVNTGGVSSVKTVANATDAASAGAFQLVFTNATSGSPSALTAGEVDVFLAVVDPTKLDNA